MNGHCAPARRVLAQSGFCSVEECSCGVLHVSFGVITLRLSLEVVNDVWSTLGEALARRASERRSPRDTPRAERPS